MQVVCSTSCCQQLSSEQDILLKSKNIDLMVALNEKSRVNILNSPTNTINV